MTVTTGKNSMAAMVSEHLDLVYTAALRQTGDPHLAADVTQAVFVIALRKERAIPRGRAAAWLVKATRFVALNALRAGRRRRIHEERAAMEVGIMTEGGGEEEGKVSEHLDAALAALREMDRELLIQRYFQNRSVAEIGAGLGLTENAASKRIERALEKLRRQLSKRGVAAGAGALPGVLLSVGIRRAPAALAGRILAGPVVVGSIPVGILLMTAGVKMAVAAAVLAMIPVVYGFLPRHAGVAEGTVAGAAPVAVGVPGSEFTDIVGTVKGADGAPVVDVVVSQGDPPQLTTYAKTRTDVDGNFVFPHVRVGADLVVAVHAPGLSPEVVTGTVVRNGAPIAFTLQPTHTLKLRLVDARGTPLPNFALDPMFWRNTQVLRIYGFRNGRWTGPVSDAEGMVVWGDAPADEVIFQPIGKMFASRAAAEAASFLSAPFKATAEDAVQTVVIRDPIRVDIRVTDAKTGKALPTFSVTYGYGDAANRVSYWQEERTKTGSDGKYETAILDTSYFVPFQFYRVSAPGYAPVVHSFKDDQDRAELSFALSQADAAGVTVLRPDGAPAGDAEVYVIPTSQSFSLQASQFFHNGRYSFGGGQHLQRTDAEGRVALEKSADWGTRVVILHEAGFANVALSEARSPIHLKAWARVEGNAFHGSKPAAHTQIQLRYTSDGKPYIEGTFETKTDDRGNFAFEMVPPGEYFVGTLLEIYQGSSHYQGTTANTVKLKVAAGGTTTVRIGGAGRPVTGRIVSGPGLPPPDHWMFGLGYIWTKLDQKHPERMRTYAFKVEADGRFRADDILAGEYELKAGVSDGTNNQLIGAALRSFTIPPVRGGQSDEAVELGDVAVQAGP